MKKFLITGLSVLFVALALFSCGSEEPKEKPAPAPTPEAKIEVLLNGVVVKDKSVVDSKALVFPVIEGLKYQFSNILAFKSDRQIKKEKYAFYIKKLGGNEVPGIFNQVCLVGRSYSPVDDNTYSAFLEPIKANEKVQYEVDYALGVEKPSKEVDAKLFVELKKGDKLLHSFTIKMTYKP